MVIKSDMLVEPKFQIGTEDDTMEHDVNCSYSAEIRKETLNSSRACKYFSKWLPFSNRVKPSYAAGNGNVTAKSRNRTCFPDYSDFAVSCMIEFLEQLLSYLDDQLEKKLKFLAKHQLPFLYSLSVTVISEFAKYQNDFFRNSRVTEDSDGVTETDRGTQLLYSQYLLGQLYHHTRAITRLRIVSGGWSYCSNVPRLQSIDFSTFPALQYLYLESINEEDLRNLFSLSSQLRLLSVQHAALKSIASILLSNNVDPIPVPADGNIFEWDVSLTKLGMGVGRGAISGELPRWLRLEVLKMSSCNLAYTDPSLRLLTEAKHIDLSDNKIEDIDFFQDCVKLEHLNVSHNCIRNLIDVNQVIGNIRVLLLSHNKIRSTNGLEKLYSLEVLDLGYNWLSEVEEISRIGWLPCLLELTLKGNPLARQDNYRITVMTILQQSEERISSVGLFTLDGESTSCREKRKLVKSHFNPTKINIHAFRDLSATQKKDGDESEICESNIFLGKLLNIPKVSSEMRPSGRQSKQVTIEDMKAFSSCEELNDIPLDGSDSDSESESFYPSRVECVDNNSDCDEKILEEDDYDIEELIISTRNERPYQQEKNEEHFEIPQSLDFSYDKKISPTTSIVNFDDDAQSDDSEMNEEDTSDSNETKVPAIDLESNVGFGSDIALSPTTSVDRFSSVASDSFFGKNERSSLQPYRDILPQELPEISGGDGRVGVKDEYYGSPAYSDLLVTDHLQLYFKEQIFCPMLNKPYLHTVVQEHCEYDQEEAFLGLFRDTVLPSAAAGVGIHMKNVLTRPSYRRNADGIPMGDAAGEVPALVVLTNHRVYVVAEDGLAEKTFRSCPRPVALVSIDLAYLKEVTIGFGLQKLTLKFERIRSLQNEHMSFELVVLTRSRPRTHAMIATLESAASLVRQLSGVAALHVTNDDSSALEGVSTLLGGLGIVLYHLVVQRWELRPWVAVPRSIISSQTEILLCDEIHGLANKEQPFICIERAMLSDIIRVDISDNASQIVMEFKPRGVMSSKKKWFLQCRTGSDAEKVVGKIRRLHSMSRRGSSSITSVLKDLVL